MTMLDPQELQRYARHIMLAEVGGGGQQKLKAARVLLVGAGGIGAPPRSIWRRRAWVRWASSMTMW